MADDAACERIAKFVENGGTLVSTYFTGWVDENDLCRLGGFPGGKLSEVFGVWSEDLDCLHNGEKNGARMLKPVKGLKDSYEIIEYCDLLHTRNDEVEVLAEFTDDYFAGMPALTVNRYGKGKAYYIGFKNEGDFMADLIYKLTDELGIKGAADIELPENAAVTMRTDGEHDYVFIQNYNSHDISFVLDGEYFDMLDEKKLSGDVTLNKFGVLVLKRKSR
jgi:beta-galactosidase